MTIAELHEATGKAIANGHGDKKIVRLGRYNEAEFLEDIHPDVSVDGDAFNIWSGQYAVVDFSR